MKNGIEIYGYRKILDKALDSLKSSVICEKIKRPFLNFRSNTFQKG
jgi:hypothetical protein